jgi:ABC-type transport system involved in multi-copper enzyme maturation permease subunit
MRALAANIEDVFREAAARWTLVAYFALSSIFILIFALSVNLDIANGALAGAKLFGHAMPLRGDDAPSLEKVVSVFETAFSGLLFPLGVFLAVFATAHLVPRLQEKGTIDLYLARPVPRVPLLLSRYLAGLLLSAANVVYLLGSIWAIVVYKTHVVHPRFLLAGTIILFTIATLLAFAFLVGVVTSSTAVCIMSTYAVFVFSAALAAHDQMAALLSSQWAASLVHGLYWVFPKTAELARAVVALVMPSGEVPKDLQAALTLSPFLTTAAFGIACLVLASWLFSRKDF